jgi:hypothetical protein
MLSKCVMRRMWGSQTPLRQFKGIPYEILTKVGVRSTARLTGQLVAGQLTAAGCHLLRPGLVTTLSQPAHPTAHPLLPLLTAHPIPPAAD